MRHSIPLFALVVALASCAKSKDGSSDKSAEPIDDPSNTKNAGEGKDDPPQHAGPDRPPAAADSPLTWLTDEKVALARAKKEAKPLLIEFSAAWCMPCKELERRTFTDPAVIETLSAMVLLRFDVTEQTKADEAVQERYRAKTLPMLIALTPDGKELARITEFLEPEPFLRALARRE